MVILICAESCYIRQQTASMTQTNYALYNRSQSTAAPSHSDPVGTVLESTLSFSQATNLPSTTAMGYDEILPIKGRFNPLKF